MIMVLTISGSDTDIVGGGSDVEVGEILEPTAVETPVAMEPRVRAPARAFARLDAVDLHDLFESRCLTSSEELFVALRLACQEILEGMETNSEVKVVRVGNSFWFCPR